MSTPGDRSLRVLHLITTLDRGGAEKALLHLVRSLAGLGVDCDVGYLKGPGELRPEFEASGARVHALGESVLGQIGAYGRARRLVRELWPDVVHTHLFKADCLGAAIRGRRERSGTHAGPHGLPRLVSTKHNEDVYLSGDGPKPRALRGVARRVAARADALVAITPGVAAFFAEHLGESAATTRVIPYGLPRPVAGDGAAFRRTHGIPEHAPLAVCPARFVPQKDHATLVDAFARLGTEAWLVLLGRGPLEPDVRKRAAGVPQIVFAGFVDDPTDAFSAADVVVLASRHEGLGLVLLEAAQHGVPAVATRVGGIPDVVRDGETGLLAPPGDPVALGDALRRVLSDDEFRRTLGAAAAARVNEEHTVDRCADAHVDLYRGLA